MGGLGFAFGMSVFFFGWLNECECVMAKYKGGKDELGDEKTGGDVDVRLTQAGFII